MPPGSAPRQVDFGPVFKRLDQVKDTLCGKIDGISKEISTIREEKARAEQWIKDHKLVDHSPPERPCEGLKKLDKRFWAVVLAFLVCAGKAAWDFVRSG